MPARPTKPVPRSPSVPGSGVTTVSLLPIQPNPDTLTTPATVTPAVVTPLIVRAPALWNAVPLLNVPLNNVTLLAFITVTVPPVMVHTPPTREVVTEISTVPAVAAPPLILSWWNVRSTVPLETLPVTVAGVVMAKPA